MNNLCDGIERHTSLTLKAERQGKARLYVVFANRHKMTLWFPHERLPSYEVDEAARLVVVHYGYFEEFYGAQRERYMLPPMRAVPDAGEHSLEIKDRKLVRLIFASGYRTRLQARVALRAFAKNDVRGEQELDAYLKESCIIRPPEISPEQIPATG
ncbi:MAG TPA: hypothetical protein VNA19_10575 [Pyrinomonadaceae bacterium]|jgi:hypothetical protein|nr:hypothetical protein [Pyrinomonadaceae bacterium]